MRASYTDEEVKALQEILNMLSSEINRQADIIMACLKHLDHCETPQHRAEITGKIGVSVSAIMTHLRYCGWIEAELTKPPRVFENPIAVLEDLVRQQEEMATKYKVATELAPTDPAPAVPEILAPTTDGQGTEMDKLATTPFPKTIQ